MVVYKTSLITLDKQRKLVVYGNESYWKLPMSASTTESALSISGGAVSDSAARRSRTPAPKQRRQNAPPPPPPSITLQGARKFIHHNELF